MNLWESFIIILKQEPIYALILVLIGTLITVVNKLKKKDDGRPIFTVFSLSVTLPLLLIRSFGIYYRIEEDLKPILYFITSLVAANSFYWIGSVLEAVSKLILQKENLSGIAKFLIELLTKVVIKNTQNDMKDDTKHDD